MVDVNDIIKDIQRLEREAFDRGWKAAMDSIFEAASRGRTEPAKAVELVPFPPADEPDDSQETAKPTVQVIREVIEERPGLRGADVFREAVKRISGSDFKKMDRTGRTALKRLKDREAIHQRGKKWYPGPAPSMTVQRPFADIVKEAERE